LAEGLSGFRADRIAVLAEGNLGVLSSKTAACLVRYQPERVLCVIDSTKSGRTVGEVLGFGGGTPVVASLQEGFALGPDTLLVGIAPRGGALPADWRKIVLDAIEHGLNVISGLHTMLGEDAEIAEAAAARGAAIWDIRRAVFPTEVSTGVLMSKTGKVILTVGSDCRTGKMTVAYELARCLKGQGRPVAFVPTGQTGILLAGWGIAVDRVPGDFMARVTEDLTLEGLSRAPLAIVEGQGSLVHPGYSGVSLALLHGSCPDALILCHDPGREEVEGYGVRIPPLEGLVRLYEEAAAPVFPSRVAAVALNTYALREGDARRAVAAAAEQTGLYATDVVRWGAEGLCTELEGLL
jgi:uncharacterized NAD-dependent epimerase/dehydratase family protein